jgi:hypothetical protein
MLQDKFLPQYQFNEKHSLTIHAPADKVYQSVLQMNFSNSWIIRLLFKIRGLPTGSICGIEGVKQMGFTLLEYDTNNEIVLGLVGQFWKPHGNIQPCTPEEFIQFSKPDFAKTTWNFEIIKLDQEYVRLETETRILCLSETVRRRFARYWFFIKPFSGLIRMEILRSIKKSSEKSVIKV